MRFLFLLLALFWGQGVFAQGSLDKAAVTASELGGGGIYAESIWLNTAKLAVEKELTLTTQAYFCNTWLVVGEMDFPTPYGNWRIGGARLLIPDFQTVDATGKVGESLTLNHVLNAIGYARPVKGGIIGAALLSSYFENQGEMAYLLGWEGRKEKFSLNANLRLSERPLQGQITFKWVPGNYRCGIGVAFAPKKRPELNLGGDYKAGPLVVRMGITGGMAVAGFGIDLTSSSYDLAFKVHPLGIQTAISLKWKI